MKIEILNDADEVVNTILASEAYAEARYPGKWRAVVEAPAVEPVSWRITRLAFRNRFTAAEKAALYTAAVGNVGIRVYLDDVNAATFIDLTRADTIAGVQSLEAATIIAAGRAAVILTTPPTADEIWHGA